MMKIAHVHISNPRTVPLLRPTLERIVAFCEAFDSDADTETMFVECSAAFFAETPALIMFAGIDEAGKVVAHLLASMNDYYGGRFVTILQCWKNANVDFEMAGKHGLVEMLKGWGREAGASRVQTFARNETVAQILEKYNCGFTRSEKVILSVPIEKEKDR